jgi:hypothetical protein
MQRQLDEAMQQIEMMRGDKVDRSVSNYCGEMVDQEAQTDEDFSQVPQMQMGQMQQEMGMPM